MSKIDLAGLGELDGLKREPCALSKPAHVPRQSKEEEDVGAKRSFEKVHGDLVGSNKQSSIWKLKYFVTFKD